MKQIIVTETDKMIASFMRDFFIPYMDKNLEHVPQGQIANIVMSFAQSMLITLVHPIFEGLPTEKQKLRHLKEMVQIIEGHLYKMNKLEKNKIILN